MGDESTSSVELEGTYDELETMVSIFIFISRGSGKIAIDAIAVS